MGRDKTPSPAPSSNLSGQRGTKSASPHPTKGFPTLHWPPPRSRTPGSPPFDRHHPHRCTQAREEEREGPPPRAGRLFLRLTKTESEGATLLQAHWLPIRSSTGSYHHRDVIHRLIASCRQRTSAHSRTSAHIFKIFLFAHMTTSAHISNFAHIFPWFFFPGLLLFRPEFFRNFYERHIHAVAPSRPQMRPHLGPFASSHPLSYLITTPGLLPSRDPTAP